MIENRTVAGIRLAEKLQIANDNPIILAIPRGGVVVGHEIAKKLGCNLDVAISKKITPPDKPEYAIGAITYDGSLYKGRDWKFFSEDDLANEIKQKQIEVKRRLETYRGNTDYDFTQKTVILVDDGIATGSTIFAILNWLKKIVAKKIIIAVPVLPSSTYEILQNYGYEIVFLEKPLNFSAVGEFFSNFEQVSDEQVQNILSQYR